MHGVEASKDAPRGTVTQRNIWWAMLLAELLMKNQSLRDVIPDGALMIVLPEDDAELREYNEAAFVSKRTNGHAVLVKVRIEGPKQVMVQPFRALAPEQVFLHD